ncbi:hypothetical protein Uis4E_2206 [Bifidobacterium parmae]|uniref:Uncharacterized protein n=1 Tax=Bifidobacterium parmae TaxID=361854 RepID=A0A2N5IVP7_9BIFI|nr:hypothetical protein Uis4E_2206 [Bifidobacterium parmae]
MELAATRAAARTWRQVNPGDIRATWKTISIRLAATLAAIQTQTVGTVADANPMTLAEQGDYVAPAGFLDPTAFAGWAPSGIPLADYLQTPALTSLHAIRTGRPITEALQAGQSTLMMLTALAVTDTARQAEQADIALRAKVGFVRVESASCCDRCMILAGKWYRFNEGFLRHPHCHGRHLPCRKDTAAEEGWVSDPMDAFRALSREEQDRRFGPANAQAIRDGADIYQVVNARRGMQRLRRGYTAMTTSEGMSRYGWARMMAEENGRPLKRRLTPDAIYTLTRGDRAKTIEALKRNGYIIPNGWRADVPDIRRKRWRHDNTYRQGRRETITAAQKRVQSATLQWQAVLEGRNPYDARMPLTPDIAADVERRYRRWLATNGQIYTQ